MSKTRSKNLPNATVGSLVLVLPDPKERASMGNFGVLGIIFFVNEYKSAQVVTEHGILSDGKGKPISFPHDKYQLKEKSDVKWFGGKLGQLQEMVINGTFDKNAREKLTLQKACRLIHGGKSGRLKCSCKKGCKKNCGCAKKNRRCTSSCPCLGNCAHSINFTATNQALSPRAYYDK